MFPDFEEEKRRLEYARAVAAQHSTADFKTLVGMSEDGLRILIYHKVLAGFEAAIQYFEQKENKSEGKV